MNCNFLEKTEQMLKISVQIFDSKKKTVHLQL